jgi:Dipeptidyl aminopeptidases/acylaminoacyl-peptidases
VGTSDIGWFFSEAYTGSDAERIAAQSPMAHVGAVRTPTLVIHSEQDLRCPLEQAQRYFAALRRGGVEAEMLVVPRGEPRALAQAGRRGTGASASRRSFTGGGATWGEAYG